MEKKIDKNKVWKYVKEDLICRDNLEIAKRSCYLTIAKIKRDIKLLKK